MTASVKKLIPTMQAAEMAKVSQMTLSSLRMRKDFPEPEVRGWYRLIDVESWVADRRKGLPMASGRILQAWSAPAVTLGRLLELRAVCEAARTTESTLRMWVRRGDFPKSVAKGHWLAADVENWVADRKKDKPMAYSLEIPVKWRPAITEGHYSSHALLPICRLGANKIYDLMHRGDFPKQLPAHKGKWAKRSVDEWIAARQRGEPLPQSKQVLKSWENEYHWAHPLPQSAALLSRQFADIHYSNRLTDEQRAATDILAWRESYPVYLARNGTQDELDEYNAAMRLNQSPHAQIARPGAPLPKQASTYPNHPNCDPDDSDEVRATYPSANEPDDNDEDYGLDDI